VGVRWGFRGEDTEKMLWTNRTENLISRTVNKSETDEDEEWEQIWNGWTNRTVNKSETDEDEEWEDGDA
jgi:hypothetical protein